MWLVPSQLINIKSLMCDPNLQAPRFLVRWQRQKKTIQGASNKEILKATEISCINFSFRAKLTKSARPVAKM